VRFLFGVVGVLGAVRAGTEGFDLLSVLLIVGGLAGAYAAGHLRRGES
jgi:hypothetical protein